MAPRPQPVLNTDTLPTPATIATVLIDNAIPTAAGEVRGSIWLLQFG